MLRDPQKRIRDHAYHAFPRHGRIGYAICTERYRMVEWIYPDDESVESIFELYDYREDPLETQNLASSRPKVLSGMRTILARHPRARAQVRK